MSVSRFLFKTTASDTFQAGILANLAEGEILIVHRYDDRGSNLAKVISENPESDGVAESSGKKVRI